MRFYSHVMRAVLVVVALVVTGCNGINVEYVEDLSDLDNHYPDGREPFAVLAFGPAENWLSDLEGLASEGGDKVQRMGVDGFREMVPGINFEKPMGALIFLDEAQQPEPVVFIPVNDYDKFMEHLEVMFKVHRAVASSFKIGSKRWLVKKVNDYAYLSPTLDRINGAPANPTKCLLGVDETSDVCFTLFGKTIPYSQKQKLAVALSETMGVDFESMVFGLEDFSLSVDLNEESGLAVDTRVRPVPENFDEIKASVASSLSLMGISLNSSTTEGEAIASFEFQPETVSDNLTELSTLGKIFSERSSLFASKRKREESAFFPVIKESEGSDGGLGASGFSFGGSSSSQSSGSRSRSRRS